MDANMSRPCARVPSHAGWGHSTPGTVHMLSALEPQASPAARLPAALPAPTLPGSPQMQ